MNQPGIFDEIVLYFRSILEGFPDKRTGKNKRYQISDAALSAFSVFFTQSPSFLAHQKLMALKKGHNNAQSLFGVHQIPSDNQIRDLLDEVEPDKVFPVFSEIFRVLEKGKHLDVFRCFENNLLIALDGTEYFCSNQIHCQHCSSRTFRNGTTQYFHGVVTPVIVCPGNSKVIPLIPEFVVPQDGHQKQDCENTAAKLDLTSEKYQFIRQHLPTRKTFFDDLRALTRYLYFDSWENLLDFMIHGLELEFHPNTS